MERSGTDDPRATALPAAEPLFPVGEDGLTVEVEKGTGVEAEGVSPPVRGGTKFGLAGVSPPVMGPGKNLPEGLEASRVFVVKEGSKEGGRSPFWDSERSGFSNGEGSSFRRSIFPLSDGTGERRKEPGEWVVVKTGEGETKGEF